MPRYYHFTAQNAKAYGLRGAAGLAVARKQRAEAKAQAEAAALTASRNPAPATGQAGTQADTYRGIRLARVRAILDTIDEKAIREKDPQASSWWATAAGKWSEQEFDLADRSRPGNRRPGPEKGGPRGGGVFWGQSAPVVAPPVVPSPVIISRPEPGPVAPAVPPVPSVPPPVFDPGATAKAPAPGPAEPPPEDS